MTRLYFVGDGPTDGAAVPGLVERILGHPITKGGFSSWKSLSVHHRGKGYDRKLRYAVRQAVDRGLNGVVATVDRDNASSNERLGRMLAGRAEDRQDSNKEFLPTAVGEAIPHLEAWLVDDEKAIRDSLRLSNDAKIPNVLKVDPKTAFNELVATSDCIDDKWTLIQQVASNVDINRCNHKSQTGLAAFAEDVKRELA